MSSHIQLRTKFFLAQVWLECLKEHFLQSSIGEKDVHDRRLTRMFHKIIINLKSQTKFNTSVYHKDNLVFSRYLGILQQGFADRLVRKICIHHESIILRSQKIYAVSVCHKSNKESFGVLACCILEFLNKVCRCIWGKDAHH